MATAVAEVFQTTTIVRLITGEVVTSMAHRGTTAIAAATLAITVVAVGIKPAHRN